MLEEGTDREVPQQSLQGGDERSPGQKEVMAAAQPARSLVVGLAEKRQPLAMECEIRGVVAKGCGRDTMVSGGRRCVRSGLPLPEAGRLQGGQGTGVRG
jgi:hypothetical protein